MAPGSMTFLSRRAVLRALAGALPCASLAAMPRPAGATPSAGASPWVQGLRSRARLIAGDANAPAAAAVEIALDPGFKTYWRNAGDSGLPPSFAWSASENMGNVEVLWPAPTRFEEAGGVAYGYGGSVVLPLRVTPARADAPVRLVLGLEYGVCKDICIPARAEMALELLPGDGGHGAAIAAALARVPRAQEFGASGPLSILHVDPVRGDGPPRIAVTVRAPASPEPQLFPEGPQGWYLGAAEGLEPRSQPRLGPLNPRDPVAGSQVFSFEILERPKDSAAALDLGLTLVSGNQAIQTDVRLDAGALPR